MSSSDQLKNSYSILKLLTVLTGLIWCQGLLAKEGFFRPEQVKVQFDLTNLKGASLLVEEYDSLKQTWKHTANAFFVSRDGSILTNYHIAATCIQSNKNYFRQHYKSPSEISRKGFVSATADGVPCPGLRFRNSQYKDQVLFASLRFLPQIPQESEEGLTPQERSGPTHDFAVMKAFSRQEESFDRFDSTPIPSATRLPLVRVMDSSILEVGREVFMLGYPAETKRFETAQQALEKGYDDVGKDDYRVALGEILEVAQDYFYQPQKNRYLYTSTDGGMTASGSALVNEKGDLVGLVLGSASFANSTKFNDCVPRFQFCGGVSLYLRIDPILDTLEQQAPDLARELTNDNRKQ